jgi:hypothetical protein
MSTIAERLIKRMGTWNTGEKVGGKTDLERYLEAAAKPMEAVREVAEETGEPGHAGYVPGYGVIFNPTTCPAKWLPFLGQFVGVEVPKMATEAEARTLLKEEPGLERGTLKALEGAIRKVIGNTEPFTIQERTALNGSEAAYHFNVIVKPGKASTELKEAIERVKPGGLQFSLIEVANAWIEGTKQWGEVAAGKKWSTIKEGEY